MLAPNAIPTEPPLPDVAETPQARLAVLTQLASDVGVEGLSVDEQQELSMLLPDQPGEAFDANLAEQLEETELNGIAKDICYWFEADEQSRKPWRLRERMGIAMMGVLDPLKSALDAATSSDLPAGDSEIIGIGDDVEPMRPPFEGASTVNHPLLAEATLQFHSRALLDLWPAGGPCKTVVMGDKTPERDRQAQRVQEFLNYQYTTLMPGAFEEQDALLFRLPLSGSCFTKIYFDPLQQTVMRRFVDPNDFVAPYETTDLLTATRYTHVLRYSANDVKKLQLSGFYRTLDLAEPTDYRMTDDTVRDMEDAADGRLKTGVDSHANEHELLEMHVDLDLPGRFADPDGIARPYIVTVEFQQQRVLSIRRNWREGDPQQHKRVYFTHYRFMPGYGFYGFGWVHLIAGLANAATGTMRALLDAAQLANMQGGFRSQDLRMDDGLMDIPLRPGEWRVVKASAEEIAKGLVPLNYSEPSSTLFSLLGYLTEVAKRLTQTTDATTGNASSNAPVGTTLALIEQGTQTLSAINKRIHKAQGEEMRIVVELNHETMPPVYPYDVPGESREVKQTDFDARVDVMPVSDPQVVTAAQRVATGQALIETAQSAPQGIFNLKAVYRRHLSALRIPDIDELVYPDDGPEPADPVAEGVALLKGEPVQAAPDQHHEAHMMVHDAWFLGLDQSLQRELEGAYKAHQAEHRSMLYRLRIEQAMGMPLDQVPPEMQNEIAAAAAQIAQQIEALPTVVNSAEEAEMQRRDAIAQADTQRKDAETEAKIRREDAKADAQMGRDAVKTESQIGRDDASTEARITRENTEMESRLVREFASDLADQDRAAEGSKTIPNG